MPGKYLPTKRGNPCEVCGNTSGKCRTSEIDFGNKPATLHLCMEYPDDANTPDFKHLGQTKDSLWGKYVSVNDCEEKPSSEEEKERWRRERDIRNQQRLAIEKRRHAESLTQEQRDRFIRKLLAQLSLSYAHKSHLKRDRGFTDAEIEAGHYRSVVKFQRLDQEVDPRLAGVSLDGRSLTHHASGILCPIPNPQGLFIGWQLRLDNPDDGGKSRWSNSRSQKRPNGPRAHLPNGELPLAFCRPLGSITKLDSIGLAEGVGFKPFRTAQLFEQIIIGASGGNFASSPETFKRYLAQASEELGGKSVITLYADAGAVSKHGVLSQYRRTHKLIQDWGYTLQIAWWGQIAENTPDSDELNPTEIEAVRCISWEEFSTLADQFQVEKNQDKQRQEAHKRQEGWLKAFSSFHNLQPNSVAYSASRQPQREQEQEQEQVAQHKQCQETQKCQEDRLKAFSSFHNTKPDSVAYSASGQPQREGKPQEEEEQEQVAQHKQPQEAHKRQEDRFKAFDGFHNTKPNSVAYSASGQPHREQEQVTQLSTASSNREHCQQQWQQYLKRELNPTDREHCQQQWQQYLKHELNPTTGNYLRGRAFLEAPDPQSLWDLEYKPDKVINQRRLSLDGIVADFIAIVSPMDTGKTWEMSGKLNDLNKSVLLITDTIALAEALAVRYKCRCYNEPDIDLANVNRLVITAASLWKLPTQNKRFDYVLLDEANQIIPEIVKGHTCKPKRARIIGTFNYFAATANNFWLADADLSGLVLDWAAQVRGNKPFVLVNKFKPCQERLIYQFSSIETAFEHICNLLEQGKRVLIPCDAKKTVKKAGANLAGIRTIQGIENLDIDLVQELEQKLQVLFPNKKIRLIHGDNSGEPETREHIKNINKALLHEKLDCEIYNSSMKAGISIDVDTFDEVVCLFNGYSLCHPELGQLMHRYRPKVPISFWINSKSRKGLETNCYKIANDYLYKNHCDGLVLKIDPNTGMVGIDNPEFIQLVSSLEARRNYSLLNIEAELKRHLSGMGYEIIPHPDEYLYTALDGVEKRLKEHGKVVDSAKISTICKSPLLEKIAASSLRNKPNPQFEENCALTKFDLHEFYGLEVTEELIDKDDKGKLRQKLTRLELLLNPDLMAKRKDFVDRRNHHVITDLKHYTLQRQLLEEVGITDYIDPLQEYTAVDLALLGERGRNKSKEFKKLLGITISVAPFWLKRLRRQSHKAVQALFKHNCHLIHIKALLSILAGTLVELPKKFEFESQEKADEYCHQLTPLAQLLVEVIAIEKRFNALECPNSTVHALLCNAIGLKRKKLKETSAGRVYQIDFDSFEFAMQVLAHREQLRERRREESEQELEEEARRFKCFNTEEMQAKVGSEIAENTKPITPHLVFLDESTVKVATPIVELLTNFKTDLVNLSATPVSMTNFKTDLLNSSATPASMTDMKIKPVNLSVTPASITDLKTDLLNSSVTPVSMTDMKTKPVNLSATPVFTENSEGSVMEIEDVMAEVPSPVWHPLMFLTACLVKIAQEWMSHTPPLSIENQKTGGCATNQPVTPGAVVQLSVKAIQELGYKPLQGVPKVDFQVEKLATGKNDLGEYHDYVQVKSHEGESNIYWLPAEWLESLDGIPIRHNCDAFIPQFSASAIGIGRNWLLGVRSPFELLSFESGLKKAEIKEIIVSLTDFQLESLQQSFQQWGVTRDWLPMPSVVDEATSYPTSSSMTAEAPKEDGVVQAAGVGKFNQFEPEDGAPTPIQICAEMVRDAIKLGLEAIKAILKPWTLERRWGALLALEDMSEAAANRLLQIAPNIYQWIDVPNEDV